MMYQNNCFETGLYPNGLGARETRVIRRFEHSGTQAGMFTFSAMLLVMLGVYLLMLNNTAENSIFNVARTPLGYWAADSTAWMLCVICLFEGIMFLVHASSLRKHSLTVTDDGIMGTTAGKCGFHPVSFELTWGEIVNVETIHSSQLRLWTNGGKYTICLSGHREARELIQRILYNVRAEDARR